jgi:hypothetical protein
MSESSELAQGVDAKRDICEPGLELALAPLVTPSDAAGGS